MELPGKTIRQEVGDRLTTIIVLFFLKVTVQVILDGFFYQFLEIGFQFGLDKEILFCYQSGKKLGYCLMFYDWC